MIEVEIRGSLSNPASQGFKTYLDKSAQEKSHYREVAIFCNTDNLENFGSFQSGTARIQATQKLFEGGKVSQIIKLKLDAPTGHGRREYAFSLATPGLVGFFEMLKRFGVAEASFRVCERYDYLIDAIEVALKFSHPIGDHFEIEMTCEDQGLIAETKSKLLKFTEPFKLAIWEPEVYKEIVTTSLSKAPYILFDEGVRKFGIL